MKILYLYAEIMPYNVAVFQELIKMGHELTVVQLDKNKLTPYVPVIDGVEIRNISTFPSYEDFRKYCDGVNAGLVFACEVKNLWYWKYLYHVNKRVPVVCGSDAQWTGNKGNWFKKIFFSLTYRRCFTHIQSAGLWQVDYATRIGFKRDQILTPLYCADTTTYQQVDIESKRSAFPKNFLFVGRLNEVKGIDHILNAWDRIADKKGWTLTLIGSGPMEDEIKVRIKGEEDITLMPFQSQKEISRIMNGVGCALIPSKFEPWGLVIHEAAAAALPIIVSKHCGATYKFVVNGFNGLLIEENSTESLLTAMQKIMASSSEELYQMGVNSRRLSNNIKPIDVAAAINSLLR